MYMEQEFLLSTIYDSIDNVCNDYPLFALVNNDKGLGLIWYHNDDINSMWEMFVSNTIRDEYFKYIEQEFYIQCNKKLNILYKLYPVEFNNQLCTSIILEW